MSSHWSMSSELSPVGQERRDAFVNTVYHLTDDFFSMETIHEVLIKGGQRLADRLAKNKVLPTLSADYFGWRVEKDWWGFFVSRGNMRGDPPYPYSSNEPTMYGAPYSEIYLSYLESREQEAKVAEEIRQLETNRTAPAPLRLPSSTERRPELMAKLWDELLPGRPYEHGCDEPFALRITSSDWGLEVNIGSCFGTTEEEVTDSINRASFMLGAEVVVLFISDADGKIFLALGLEEGAEVENSAVKRRFKAAWFDLLAVNLQWLRLRPVNIVTALDEINKNLIRPRPNKLMAEMEKARMEIPGKVESRILQARQLKPEDPQRAVKFLRVQLASTRVAARAAAANIDAEFSAIKSFVTDPRFGCLATRELTKMVEDAAVSVAEEHVRLLPVDCRDIEEAEETVTGFVLSGSWDDVLSRGKRLEVCERTLGQYPLLRRSLDAWVAQMRIRLSG
ncbi:uncharacterized protein GGS22DRAFT_193932 [Annulohypoxylon maeteangense]|uniref:uncharacterized protein n=1 Tax=Annulohypoxylon maeteangense TaxID=1927788 RepID=UPI0020072D73|nr:uncharacterized protein GGS22DRAFT_193932 [Annulohypoxylon maeteangense]KAI0879776.1 hypothetical protein GGS22DRAFT_193932 [Annulohypoxylon maeteangense]